MPSIRAVLFDLDGTLVDTAPDFYRIFKQVLEEHQVAIPEYARLRAIASDGGRAMLQLAVDPSDDRFEPILKAFLTEYRRAPVLHGSVFDGAQHLLKQLEANKIPWGVVTNKPKMMSLAVLDALSLTERCSILICPEDVQRTKPDPEGLFKATTALEVASHESLYLGDHKRDIDAGRAAGMKTLGCCYGYITENEDPRSWHADLYVDQPEQLWERIEALVTN